MDNEMTLRKRIILDFLIIGSALLSISFMGSYLSYYAFILMPICGVATVFRLEKYWIAVPLIVALITYWVGAFNDVPDGAFFYALLYFVISGIGIIIGSLILVAWFRGDSGIVKKVILTVIAAAISLALIVSTFQYTGNPFTTSKARVAIESYVENTYAGKGYIVSDPQYDWTIGKYYCSVFDENEKYIFDVLYEKGELIEDYSVAENQ